MDIEKIKKLSKNASEAGRLVKAVTAFKNELKDKEKMHDITMSEHFKTLREPLIEQQKKTDEKQDQVIEQLQKNQLALTSGIQDIMTLNRELPQVEPEEYSEPRKLSAPAEKGIYADIDQNFTDEDLTILKEKDLIFPPSELLKYDVVKLQDYQQKVKEKSKKTGTTLGAAKRKGLQDDNEELVQKEKANLSMKKYEETVQEVINLKKNMK